MRSRLVRGEQLAGGLAGCWLAGRLAGWLAASAKRYARRVPAYRPTVAARLYRTGPRAGSMTRASSLDSRLRRSRVTIALEPSIQGEERDHCLTQLS